LNCSFTTGLLFELFIRNSKKAVYIKGGKSITKFTLYINWSRILAGIDITYFDRKRNFFFAMRAGVKLERHDKK
jgi:hypothetical protein